MHTVKATWTGGLRFVTETGSGHAVVTDAPPAAGGTDTAPSPIELVLAGLAACTGVDVVAILAKMQLPFARLEIAAEAERAEDHPRVFTRIRLHYILTGDVPERKLARAVSLSAEKYCSVAAMLAGTATIDHDLTIVPTATS